MRTTRGFFALSLAAVGAGVGLAPQEVAACGCPEEYWGDVVSRTDVIFGGGPFEPLIDHSANDSVRWAIDIDAAKLRQAVQLAGDSVIRYADPSHRLA